MALKKIPVNDNNFAVAYYRYSSHSQNDASIDQQREQAHQYADDHGFVIVKEYADAAISGTKSDRPQFQLMLSEIGTIKPAALILWKIDRLSRDAFDLAIAQHFIREAGCGLHFIAEPTPDGTPESDLIQGIFSTLAVYYSGQLQKNILRGMTYNATNSMSNGHTMLGYDAAPDKHYVINEAEAAIVRRIYSDYINGKRMKIIMDELNAAGLTTKRGGQFTINSLRRILENRKYTGEYRWRDIVNPDGMPAIITEEVFERAQKVREANKRAPKVRDENDAPRFWLTGKLYCGKCKQSMSGISGTGKHGEKHYYYACSGQRKYHTCDKKAVRQALIEQAVLRGLSEYLRDPACLILLTDAIESYHAAHDNDTSMIDAMEAELKTVEKSLNNLLKALEKGIFGKTTQARLQELEERQETLTSAIEIEKLKRELSHDATLIRRFLESFQYSDITDTETRDFVLEHLVDRIYVYDDKLVIVCHYDGKTKEVSLSPETDEAYEEIMRILQGEEPSGSASGGGLGFDNSALGSTRIFLYEPRTIATPSLRQVRGSSLRGISTHNHQGAHCHYLAVVPLFSSSCR